MYEFEAGPGRGGNPLGADGTGSDDLRYNTLGYANGPGQKWIDPATNKRTDVSQDNFEDVTYRPPTPVPMESETHGGEDVRLQEYTFDCFILVTNFFKVPIWAKGPYAHFLSGVHQQSYIPYVAAFAACLGDGVTHCNKS